MKYLYNYNIPDEAVHDVIEFFTASLSFSALIIPFSNLLCRTFPSLNTYFEKFLFVRPWKPVIPCSVTIEQIVNSFTEPKTAIHNVFLYSRLS